MQIYIITTLNCQNYYERLTVKIILTLKMIKITHVKIAKLLIQYYS